MLYFMQYDLQFSLQLVNILLNFHSLHPKLIPYLEENLEFIIKKHPKASYGLHPPDPALKI